MLQTSMELLKVYLQFFRPYASRGLRDHPDDSLWLRLDGNPEVGIGRYVKMFYASVSNLHITTTRMRSLTETVANDLHEVCCMCCSFGYLTNLVVLYSLGRIHLPGRTQGRGADQRALQCHCGVALLARTDACICAAGPASIRGKVAVAVC